MHVCFVTRLTEHLGIQLLVALLDRAGHRVDHVFDPGLESAGLFPADWNPGLLNTDEQTIQMILDTGSDMVGFNLEINTFAWSVEIAQKLKARNPDLMIIVGGVHATTVPHVVMEFECFDYLCMGEGDVAFLELLDALDKNADTTAIGNIHARLPSGEVAKNAVRPLLKDLDDLPFFDKSISLRPRPRVQPRVPHQHLAGLRLQLQLLLLSAHPEGVRQPLPQHAVGGQRVS